MPGQQENLRWPPLRPSDRLVIALSWSRNKDRRYDAECSGAYGKRTMGATDGRSFQFRQADSLLDSAEQLRSRLHWQPHPGSQECVNQGDSLALVLIKDGFVRICNESHRV